MRRHTLIIGHRFKGKRMWGAKGKANPALSGRDSLPEGEKGTWILKWWENSKEKSSVSLWEIVNLGEVDLLLGM